MCALNQIPWEQLAADAEDCIIVFGCRNAKSFLQTFARKPAFPQRIGQRSATWIAGEVVERRGANRADRPIRCRRK